MQGWGCHNTGSDRVKKAFVSLRRATWSGMTLHFRLSEKALRNHLKSRHDNDESVSIRLLKSFSCFSLCRVGDEWSGRLKLKSSCELSYRLWIYDKDKNSLPKEFISAMASGTTLNLKQTLSDNWSAQQKKWQRWERGKKRLGEKLKSLKRTKHDVIPKAQQIFELCSKP